MAQDGVELTEQDTVDIMEVTGVTTDRRKDASCFSRCIIRDVKIGCVYTTMYIRR